MARGSRRSRGAHGNRCPLRIARAKGDGYELVDIMAKVDSDGRIGFVPGDTAESGTLLAMPPTSVVNVETESTTNDERPR